jgi:hypothetical protein
LKAIYDREILQGVQPGTVPQALTTKLTPFDVQDCDVHELPPLHSELPWQNCGPTHVD